MAGNLGFNANPGGTRLVIVQAVSLTLAWMVCLLRVYVKFFLTRKVLLEDWFMLASILVYSAYGVVALYSVASGGTGRHTSELTTDDIQIALRGWYLCEVLYAPLSALIRTSIALFLLRLAAKPWHIWTIRINLIVIWLFSIIYLFLMMFQCTPPSYFWLGPVQASGVAGTCMDHNVVPIATIVHSIANAISDWILGLLPVAMLWNVSINRRTKAGIAILLGMGLVAGITLVIRIPYVKKIAISADFLFETIDLAVWSVCEPSLGIMAGCIATIRPLFKGWGFGLNRSRRNGSRQLANSPDGGAVQVWLPSRDTKCLAESHSSNKTDPSLVQPENSRSSCVSHVELSTVETVSDQYDGGPNRTTRDLEGGSLDEHKEFEIGNIMIVRTSLEGSPSHHFNQPERQRRVQRPANIQRWI